MEVAWNLMKWPLLACLLLPGILVYYGLHIVRREIIFVDLALAQVAALGTCLAILMGYHVHQWQTFAWGIAFTLVGAVLFTLTRRRDPRVPQEALIGIVYVVAAAAALLLLSHNPEGNDAAHPRHWYRITGLRGWERAELGIPAFGEPHCVPQASPGIFQRLRRALRRWRGRRTTPASKPSTARSLKP